MGILGLIAASAFAGDALDTVASAGVSKSAAVQAVRGRAAVSYTHLDVYKRQYLSYQ